MSATQLVEASLVSQKFVCVPPAKCYQLVEKNQRVASAEPLLCQIKLLIFPLKSRDFLFCSEFLDFQDTFGHKNTAPAEHNGIFTSIIFFHFVAKYVLQ